MTVDLENVLQQIRWLRAIVADMKRIVEDPHIAIRPWGPNRGLWVNEGGRGPSLVWIPGFFYTCLWLTRKLNWALWCRAGCITLEWGLTREERGRREV